MASRILDKFRKLSDSFTTVSQFSHTGEGLEDRLSEPDTVIASTRQEFTSYIDHILKRIRLLKDQNDLVLAQRLTVERLKGTTLAYPKYSDYVVSFEFIKKFTSSPTYTVIVRNRASGEVLSMTHVSL